MAGADSIWRWYKPIALFKPSTTAWLAVRRRSCASSFAETIRASASFAFNSSYSARVSATTTSRTSAHRYSTQLQGDLPAESSTASRPLKGSERSG